ncbi:MAG: hypothetical protein AAGC47_12850 [Bacteroidota bacterium]
MRKLLIGLTILMLLLVAVLLGFRHWAETNFGKVINEDPNRAYDIQYEDFKLHSFYSGVTLKAVSIVPLKSDSSTVAEGKVSKAELSGLKWSDLLFGRRLHLESLVFEEPQFEVNLFGKSSHHEVKVKGQESGLQSLLADVIARADLEDFIIKDGTVSIKDGISGKLKGKTKRINVWAEEIQTDSVMFKNIVPFELGNLRVELDSVLFNLDEHTQANMAHLSYDLKKGDLTLEGLSLGFDRSWIEISHQRRIQNDVIDFELQKLSITEMDFYSSILSDLDIEAGRMSIEGLDLRIQRNKNYNRPADEVKPMFKGMIDSIPFTLIIDTIDVINSSVSYSEISEGKDQPGTISISEINGKIVDLNTSDQEREGIENLKSSFTASLNRSAPMKLDLAIPYDKEAFSLNVGLSLPNMKRLNTSLIPLVGVEIQNGHLHDLRFSMEALRSRSWNKLTMNYDSLNLTVLKEMDGKGLHKNELATGLANVAVRNKNIPGTKHYREAEYISERNVFRAPFQFIVQSMMEGIMEIVPTNSAKAILNSQKKRKDKRKNKKRKKKK